MADVAVLEFKARHVAARNALPPAAQHPVRDDAFSVEIARAKRHAPTDGRSLKIVVAAISCHQALLAGTPGVAFFKASAHKRHLAMRDDVVPRNALDVVA